MALQNYRLVARGRRLPAFLRSRNRLVKLGSETSATTEHLWAAHDGALVWGTAGPRASALMGGRVTLLDVKIEIANRLLGTCCLCERRCGVDRLHGETGFCGVGTESFYHFDQILWGEEPPLAPSHEVFFSGCNMRCKYCYSWESILDPTRGSLVEARPFADMICGRRNEGAANLNLIGGEPTVHLPNILAALKLVEAPTAVVWNSNFYMSRETMRLLDSVVDLYLGDFRFGNDACASEIGRVNRYCSTAKRNFLMAARAGDLVIRHLVMPGHVDCCLKPIAEWVAENMPDVPFSLMFQYTPFFEALDDPKLCRCLTSSEEEEATRIASSIGLNTTRWKQPLRRGGPARKMGKGELSTTITIGPNGRVGVMHLHGELLEMIRSLSQGGQPNG